MAVFNKFDGFIERVFEAEINFASHSFKVVLSNTLPLAANNNLADITQIANGNGYLTGGSATTVTSSAQVAGLYKAVFSDVIFTATGAVGPFRYAVLYDDTHASDALVGWWDYATGISLVNGETFTVDFSATNGAIQAI